MKENMLKKILITTFGSVLVSAAVYWFMVPYNLTIGGTAGLSIAITKFIPGIPVGAMQLGINVILFALAIILIGAEFGGLSIYATVVLSVALMIFEKFFPNVQPLVDTPFMSMVLGVGFTAIGIAMTLNQNASTGGTDIVGKILNKYLHIDLSLGVFIADFSVVLMGYFAFGTNAAMYALVGIVFNAIVIDKVLTGYKTKMKVYINSAKWEEINDYILYEIVRGSTIYEAKGGYNKQPKVIIETVLSRPEYINLINYIKEIDKSAFVNVSTISEVLGEGFSHLTDESLKLLKEKNKTRNRSV
ncbi:MAG: YitT family protein [Peptoniphilaceae bacterium]|uniref:YitT family protein n=1 Tax=Parvimonas sp. TaxID=1944660 RepID=UPI0025D5E5FF|nr:YitT family protein [Parvimonas sp.]MCI5996994.1 YitT family protein [Parvimonas sp.]MDD7765080.1 YitT family protein [Peptoniphilaceae bacterium]MDY3050236.1 YitT family protein [Parvimonas sp.]